jgi:hypothetical protein
MRLIIVLSHVGRIEEARAEVPAALKLRPDMSVHEYDRWVKLLCISDDWRQRIATGLKLGACGRKRAITVRAGGRAVQLY